MRAFLQSRLRLPNRLRRSELLDWACSRPAHLPLPVMSRRMLLVSAGAVPVAIAAPSVMPWRPAAGQAGAQDNNIALIPLLISGMRLSSNSIAVGQRVSALLELDNSESDRTVIGSVLTAIYDDEQYVEAAVETGSGLLSYHPNFPDRRELVPDGPPYSHSRIVSAGLKYSLPVAMPVKTPGEKQLEALTLMNLQFREFTATE